MKKRNSLLTLLCSAAMLALAACGADPARVAQLQTASDDISQRQYDQAMANANAVANADPTGPTAAEAFYLRGRAEEERTKPDAAASARDLNDARADYVHALSLSPSKELEGRIHAGIANVAYFQDDYSGAADEWGKAYALLNDQDWKSWALYRQGLSQQRLGLFSQADTIFDQVQAQFPNTPPAQRAAEHRGVHEFWVQLGAYSRGDDAGRAFQKAQAAGIQAQRDSEPSDNGLILLRVGPYSNYIAAQQTKASIAGSFPEALVTP
jgi:tetratricopeptide (TPR) repeat protein